MKAEVLEQGEYGLSIWGRRVAFIDGPIGVHWEGGMGSGGPVYMKIPTANEEIMIRKNCVKCDQPIFKNMHIVFVNIFGVPRCPNCGYKPDPHLRVKWFSRDGYDFKNRGE